ncbi:MAG TPA: DHA2 family efflux MFS transporter permease subunit [Rhizomicrobium sp.]|nr:DHA2 family efflux MFS transporter permease subunit [Rhizomicrobium sp.]
MSSAAAPPVPAPHVPSPMTGVALGVTALALALGTFMQVLDATIANVSLPTIAGNLGASTNQATWVVTAFVVANGIGVPLTGWLMNRYGVVRTFVVSVLAFTAMSFLCGIAWNLESLVFFRVLQGAVSGPMIPGSQALMLSIFPSSRRATALGIWSITTLVAPVCGPIIGGYISDSWHWGWIFLINVPVGLLVAFLCWKNLAVRETPTVRLPIDAVGLGLLVVWAGALQIMLDTGKNADWFNSGWIVTLGVISVVGFCAFLLWEMTEEHPIVDLSLFRNANFTLGTIMLCLGNAVFFANMLLLPLWLQTQLGYTATWAGLVTAPTGMVAVLLTPLAAQMMARFDARLVASIAFAASAVSYFMRAELTAQADVWAFVLPLLVQGVSSATFFIALAMIVLDGIPPHRIPSATGLSNFVRIIASGFAASFVTTLWDRREAFHQSRLSEAVTATAPAFQDALSLLRGLGLGELQAKAAIGQKMVSQAYLLAALDIFHLSALISLVLVGAVWVCRRPARHGAVPTPLD